MKKNKLRIGILGFGEIGQAMASFYDSPLVNDKGIARDDFGALNQSGEKLDVLHICIPGNLPDFTKVVSEKIQQYAPQGLTIIHSTVPVGTTEAVREATGAPVVHSPVRGVHPNLAHGIKTFVKYIGSDSPTAGEAAAAHFKTLGIKAQIFYKSRTTELLKLLDTTYYGMAIAYHAYAARLCEKEGVVFDRVMTDANNTYNAGYTKLGKKNVVRPVLFAPTDGKIGGHCVVPNAKLLKEQYGADPLLDAIIRHS